jgi:hypothetical protein
MSNYDDDVYEAMSDLWYCPTCDSGDNPITDATCETCGAIHNPDERRLSQRAVDAMMREHLEAWYALTID